ncbi:uncharacterized protein LOC129987775 [Argiope bruennichi]|uniref:uncharacterized protein LOC129987775 n=1 Tax=Argiope bruennichi TaxID=94029 RepID=UPI0024959C3F|nr:uncharacterized protein LOC129987775 [Argiope bruennichi]
MRSFISDYVKKCSKCSRYKAENQKPAGLLRIPAYSQRFETLAIDLLGPLPETSDGKKWIFIIEDTATKGIELFALRDATICNLLDIDQCRTPVYCLQANPVEGKNRNLKPRIAILVENSPHTAWAEKLPAIRFSVNSAKCSSTGYSAAFLQFGREMSTADDVKHDLRSVIHSNNFVAEITPYLRKFSNLHQEIKDRVEKKQDQHKKYAEKKSRNAVSYAPGD